MFTKKLKLIMQIQWIQIIIALRINFLFNFSLHAYVFFEYFCNSSNSYLKKIKKALGTLYPSRFSRVRGVAFKLDWFIKCRKCKGLLRSIDFILLERTRLSVLSCCKRSRNLGCLKIYPFVYLFLTDIYIYIYLRSSH